MRQAEKVRITCPSCRTVLISPTGRVKCSACRKVLFVTAPRPPRPISLQPNPQLEPVGLSTSSSPTPRLTGPLRAFALAVVGLGALLIAWLIFGTPANRAANAGSRNGDSSTTRSAPAHIGETVGIVDGHGFWPCGSTPEAFDELTKWAVRGDDAEVKRTMVRTHSLGLTPGLQVKILGVGLGKRRVRVLGLYGEDDDGSYRLFTEDPRTGHECWVVSEALTGPTEQHR